MPRQLRVRQTSGSLQAPLICIESILSAFPQNPKLANIVVLTGAGISAESGISTFRDANGLWETYRIEDVASPVAFRNDPETVHRFYNLRRAQLHEVAPNSAHLALAALEREWAGGFLLITQNVDDLHERAGSRNLLHLHGELRKLRCAACGAVTYYEADADMAMRCKTCSKGGVLRPDIVWFGETPYGMDISYEALGQTDIFIAIGTSGQVYPAASFAAIARRNQRGCLKIEVNPAPTARGDFSRSIIERAGDAVPRLVRELVDQSSK
jgi:NAD-dependent deacetylase